MRRLVVVIVSLLPAAAAATPVLDRTVSDYIVLGIQSTSVKNLAVDAPGCNVGVDCAQPATSSHCGLLKARHASIAAPGQLVGDRVCTTGSFFEVFRNSDACFPDCSMIADPGSASDCTQPFTAPIIGDLDGDGTPSCDADCRVDVGDIATACGVTLPFPACAPSKPVIVKVDQDCSVRDVLPGNFRCDLAPGTYGDVVVQNGARIDFGTGTTVLCSLRAGHASRVTTAGSATVLVPGRGSVKINNQSEAGTGCGGLRIVTELGAIHLGKYGDFHLDACSIGGVMDPGHGNVLEGHFIGDRILGDLDNDGRCCAPTTSTTATTTTSTTSTATTSSTTTTSGSTSTTTTSGGSTSTTTTSGGSTSTTTTSSTASTTTTTGDGGTSTTTSGTASSSTSTSTATTSTTAATTSSTTSTTTTTATSSTTTSTSVGTTTTSTSTTGSTSSTTSTSPATTTTTQPGGAFTRTIGFWKNHPAVAAKVLASMGGVAVCGQTLTDVAVDDARSVIEAMCIVSRGDQRLQLLRQLTAAALNVAAGGAPFAGFAACDAVCQDPLAATMAVSDCVNLVDAYNQSGDNVTAPFDPAGAADTTPCKLATGTTCTPLAAASCALH